MSLTSRELGKRLRDTRMKALLSQDDVGTQMGVARGTIARWETGARDISFSNLQRLAATLGTIVSALVDTAPQGTNVPPPSVAAAPAWAGPAWDKLHMLERQSIEQIAATLAEHPNQLPTILTLLFDGLQVGGDGSLGMMGVLSRLAKIDVDQLTPMAALTLLADLKGQLNKVALPSSLYNS